MELRRNMHPESHEVWNGVVVTEILTKEGFSEWKNEVN